MQSVNSRKKQAPFFKSFQTPKSRTLIQNDRKNFVLFYHLQFQYNFMKSELEVLPNIQPKGLSKKPQKEQNDRDQDQHSLTPIISKLELPQNGLMGGIKPPCSSLGVSSPKHAISQENLASQPSEGVSKNHQQNEVESQVQHKQCCQQINIKSNHQSSLPIKEDQQKSEKQLQKHQNLAFSINSRSVSNKKRKGQKNYRQYDEDNSDAVQTFKFPFMNHYIHEHSQQYLKTLGALDKAREDLGKLVNDTFINCDVRYFNWQLFAQQVGKFDVVLIDPPWRIKGAQQNDSQFMFSNCKFSLEYNTMANSQIGRIPLQLLSDQGFIFVWILNSQLDASIECMEGWGYELVEEIIWVKLKDQKINLTHGYYFMHSYEVCLVGYKCKPNVKKQDKIKIRQGISWNTIFAEVREKSQKPEDLYALVDIMFKGGKKIQIFARNHNLRFGIFSMGNELGQSYDKWLLKLQCDQCKQMLTIGLKRYKSKMKPNYDLCPKCIVSKDKSDFFQLTNAVDENVRHEYVSCNHCGTEPIWGLRFQCITCQDFDLCQNCYDKNLHIEHNFHPLDHEYMFLEVAVFGNGFHIHESKCSSCYQNPIIGIYFSCSVCKTFKLCQKCYFERPPGSYSQSNRKHKDNHQLQVIFEPQIQVDKKYECFGCKIEILQHCWMCENCYNFFFCQKCFQSRVSFKSLYANTHKKYHTLTKIF